ncbi:hypothetical protein PCE1_001029 [Barthelona sp. PCE]
MNPREALNAVLGDKIEHIDDEAILSYVIGVIEDSDTSQDLFDALAEIFIDADVADTDDVAMKLCNKLIKYKSQINNTERKKLTSVSLNAKKLDYAITGHNIIKDLQQEQELDDPLKDFKSVNDLYFELDYQRMVAKRQKRGEKVILRKSKREEDEDDGFICYHGDVRGFPALLVEDITMGYPSNILLEEATLSFREGECTFLYGNNAKGKSTLLRAIYEGKIRLDVGTIAFIQQEIPPLHTSVIDTCLLLHPDIGSTYRRRLDAQFDEDIADLNSRLAEMGVDQIRARAHVCLSGFGFTAEMVTRPVKYLSGGLRMRLAICAALTADPDLLLGDEVTNHLDIESILFLQAYLRHRFKGTMLMVSHDKEFINAVATQIVFLNHTTKSLVNYKGNFDAFLEIRGRQLETQRRERAKQDARIAHMQTFVDRFRYKAKKANMAQSRIKAIDKISLIELETTDASMTFNFPPVGRVQRDTLMKLEDVSFGYGDNPLILENIDLEIKRDSRFTIVAANAIGKSTLLKIMAGLLKPTVGFCKVGTANLSIAYFAQHHLEQLGADYTPLEHIMNQFEGEDEQTVRRHLAMFGITREQSLQKIKTLSGGQKARVSLANITFRKNPHLLLMDELTNHLDIDTRAAVISALNNFQGAIIVVSHDRSLLQATCDDIYTIENKHMRRYEGTWEEYEDYVRHHSTFDFKNL